MSKNELVQRTLKLLTEGSPRRGHKTPEAQRPTPDQWLETWQELAHLTDGVTKADSIFPSVCAGLEEADRAFESDNWPAFREAAGRVAEIINSKPKT